MHKYNTKGELVKPWEEGLYSVTTILDITHKASLQAWIDRVGKEAAEAKREEAAKRGSNVHAAISDILMGVHSTDKITDDMEPYMNAFYNWCPDENHMTDVKSELFVTSPRYGYAGSADLVCSLGDEPWVIDFKTGSPQVTHGLQLKAYQQAVFEQTGVRCRMAGLYLGTGTKKGWKLKEYREPFYVFLAHKQIFDWQLKKNPIKEPKPVWTGGKISL